jgi:imidazolonepropionase-like amidohydrolase
VEVSTGWYSAAGSARRWTLPALMVAYAGCATPTPARTAVDAGIAFTDVDVVSMAAGAGVLRGRTVLVQNGRISAIGAADSVHVPAGAQRIDGRGRYLMPGLADMHVHLEHSRDPALLALFVAHGVTTVRSMDGRPYILSSGATPSNAAR